MNIRLASFVCIASMVGGSLAVPAHPTHVAQSTGGVLPIASLPAAFVPNLGQWDRTARYRTQVGAMTVWLERDGWTFALSAAAVEDPSLGPRAVAATALADPTRSATAREEQAVAVRMCFADAATSELEPEDLLAGAHNYFLGNDPSRWRTNVPLYRSVRYRDVRPGIDVRAREHAGHFEFDALVLPEASLASLEMVVDGIDGMHVDCTGALVLATALGPVRMPVPVSWEEGPGGERTPIPCRYVLLGNRRFCFEVPERCPDSRLVVDPGLVWSTFLGGSTQSSNVRDVVLDAQGAATVAGWTLSPTFPVTPGVFATTHGGLHDAFVAKFTPDGSSLVYATFFGGSDIDLGDSLAIDAQGATIFCGQTGSADLPTTPGAFDPTFDGIRDAFVAKLSPSGTALIFATYMGGPQADVVVNVALDAQGAAWIAGWTASSTFPTTPGAYATSKNAGSDAFVSCLSQSGALLYSTFLGGSNADMGEDVVIDGQGHVTVVGSTKSADFPTTPGAYDTTHAGNGDEDVFVTRFAGTSILFSTFLGGSATDRTEGVALDQQGAVTLSGTTWSNDFPTTPGAFNASAGPYTDVFVARLSATGSTLVFSTYIGGGYGSRFAVDSRGATTVVGSTSETGFPTTPGAFDRNNDGPGDGFVLRLSPLGTDLEYSTFLGGSGGDAAAAGVALDAAGAATVVGSRAAGDFPTTPGSFSPSNPGVPGSAGYIARLDMLPTGVGAFGRSSPGCAGPLAMSVTSWPQVGNGAFELTCGSADPNSVGLIAFATGAVTTPLVLLGVEVWLDPTLLLATPTVFSDPIGACEYPLPIPNASALAGTRLFAQFVWLGSASPAPCPSLGVSASNALDVTIQP